MHTGSRVPIYEYDPETSRWRHDERLLIREIPLQIWVNGELLTTLHRTPGNEYLLAAGFLFYQGLISHYDEITARRLVCSETENNDNPLAADSLRLSLKPQPTAISRLTPAAIWSLIAPQLQRNQKTQFRLPARLIPKLPQKMRSHQELYQTTAGAHAVALFNRDGRILHCEEDVGRANACDKIVGYCLCHKIDRSSVGTLFSGRINLEMAVKITRAGFPLVLSISAPTAGAVTILKQADITYAGSLQQDRFTLFHGNL
jgi:FdhD protein